MNKHLFVDDLKEVGRTITKLGAVSTHLSDDPNQWPAEVLARAYQQIPFINQYDVSVDLQDIDIENRTGLGSVIVSTKTVEPREGAEEQLNRGVIKGIRRIRIPVIIAQGEMSPLDTFVANKKMYPLTERRIRRILFRPNVGDIISDGWRTLRVDQDWMAPNRYRAQHGYGSTSPKLSEAILPTVNPSDIDDWEAAMGANEHLKNAALDNPAIVDFLQRISEYSFPKMASIDHVVANLAPTVIQLRNVGDGYILKRADRRCYHPTEICLTRKEALAIAGPDLLKAADTSGPQVVTSETATNLPPQPPVAPVEKSGYYTVRTVGGGDMVGHVFTNVFDFDSQPKPVKIWVAMDGSCGSVQSEIWGKLAKETDDDGYIPSGDHRNDEPSGFGFFIDAGLNSRAFGPCTVVGKAAIPEGIAYYVELFDGGRVELIKVDMVRSPTKADGNRYLIPKYLTWIPIKKQIALAENAPEARKVASIESIHRTVRLITSGTFCTFRGGAVEKLAFDERNDLSMAEAEFLAATMGYDQQGFQKKVAEAASRGGGADLEGCLPVIPSNRATSAALEKTAELRRTVQPLRKDLLKEAAFVSDPNSVDAMLSLKFLNPRNVAVFARYIDNLDKAVQNMSELLIAARLGLRDKISEGALISGIKGVEGTIEDLEKLQHVED